MSHRATSGDQKKGMNRLVRVPSYTMQAMVSHSSNSLTALRAMTHITPGAEPVPMMAVVPFSANRRPYSVYM